MEREITREHSGQKEDSLETEQPQAKVISNTQTSQHVDQVTEIMDVILAIRLIPTGNSMQPLAGGVS